MLSEVSIAGIYLPPLFIYLCLTWPLFRVVRIGLLRSGLLRRVWHPALVEFSLSFILLAVLILYV
jgi:protein AaeX